MGLRKCFIQELSIEKHKKTQKELVSKKLVSLHLPDSGVESSVANFSKLFQLFVAMEVIKPTWTLQGEQRLPPSIVPIKKHLLKATHMLTIRTYKDHKVCLLSCCSS